MINIFKTLTLADIINKANTHAEKYNPTKAEHKIRVSYTCPWAAGMSADDDDVLVFDYDINYYIDYNGFYYAEIIIKDYDIWH